MLKLSVLKMLISSFLFGISPADRIMKVQTVEELIRFEKNITVQTQRAKRCRLEKAKNIFPENCLVKLDSELELANLRNGWMQEYKEVSSQCISLAFEVIELNRLENLMGLLSLAPNCLAALETRHADLLYIEEQKSGPEIEMIKPHEEIKIEESLL